MKERDIYINGRKPIEQKTNQKTKKGHCQKKIPRHQTNVVHWHPYGNGEAAVAMLTQQAERAMVTVVWHCSMLSEAKGSSKHYTTKTSKRSAIWRCVWAKQRLRFDISSMVIGLKGMEISECGECHQLSL
jgi:hypothetical protein